MICSKLIFTLLSDTQILLPIALQGYCLGFTGVLFSDDLSMQAACVAGGADARILAALNAGCDMGLVCNDREAACLALSALHEYRLPNQARLEKMRGHIPQLKIGEHLDLGDEWKATQQHIHTFVSKLV